MIGRIVARYVDVHSKNYQHCTIISAYIAVKSRLNVKHAVSEMIAFTTGPLNGSKKRLKKNNERNPK